jgi:two-component system, OmpR family, response regulator VicR
MQKEKPHVLYVEDDESLGFVTKDNLEIQGYKITHCSKGKDALEKLQTEKFDLCLFDVMLPEVDGFTLATELRKKDSHTPIIFLTAKSLKEDKLQGLRLGADDYITKPFSIEELVLKIEIFLRRTMHIQPGPNDGASSEFSLGDYTLDFLNLVVFHKDGTKRDLTQREGELMKYFFERPNVLTKRSDILISIWGNDDYFLGRSLDVFVTRLRKYLSADPRIKIENVHGVGFKCKME